MEQFYTLVYQSCIEMVFATIILPLSLFKGAEGIVSIINNNADLFFSVIIYKQLYNMGWKSIKLCIIAMLLTIFYIILGIIIIVSLAFLINGLIHGSKVL